MGMTEAQKKQIVTGAALGAAIDVVKSAIEAARQYTDTKIDALVGEGVDEALDTLKEIGDAIKAGSTTHEAMLAEIGKKATKTELQGALQQLSQETESNLNQALADHKGNGEHDQIVIKDAEGKTRCSMDENGLVKGDAVYAREALGVFTNNGANEECNRLMVYPPYTTMSYPQGSVGMALQKGDGGKETDSFMLCRPKSGEVDPDEDVMILVDKDGLKLNRPELIAPTFRDATGEALNFLTDEGAELQYLKKSDIAYMTAAEAEAIFEEVFNS